MRKKRCLAFFLSVMMVVLVTLSSNLEAHASGQMPVDGAEVVLPDVSLDASGNLVSEIDERELVPLTPEAMDFIRNYEEPEVPVEEIPVPDGSPSVSGRSAIMIPVAIAAIAAVLFAGYVSSVSLRSDGGTYEKSVLYTIYDEVKRLSGLDVDWSATYQTVFAGTVISTVITLAKVNSFLEKIESAGTAEGGVSVSLDIEDKTTLLYVLQSKNLLTTLEPDYVNVQAVNDCENYYIFTKNVSSDNCYVLYSPVPVAFGVYLNGTRKMDFYGYNYALADPLYKMDLEFGLYTLDYATGYYELTGVGSASDFTSYGLLSLKCFPFNVLFVSTLSVLNNYKINYPNGVNLLAGVHQGKVMTVSSVMNLGDISVSGDIRAYTSTDKNMYGRVSPLNKAAGAVIAGAIPDNPDIPVDPDTPGGGGGTGGGAVDLSGVLAELALISGALATMQTNIASGTAATSGVLTELAEVKAAINDLAVAGGDSAEVLAAVSGLTDIVDGMQHDILITQELITTIDANVVAQKETFRTIDSALAEQAKAITTIDKTVAEVPKLITDLQAETVVMSGTLGDVFLAQKDIANAVGDVALGQADMTDALTGAGDLVGAKVEALPSAITDSLVGAVATDLSGSQTLEGWSIFGAFQRKFPFSIPWDVSGCITLLRASPVKPVWEIPFEVESMGFSVKEKFVIDLSTDSWDMPIKVVRAFILLFFVLALVMVTRGLIKG